jgi:hypothetical protein
MTVPNHDLATRYPRLLAPQRWEWGGIDAKFSTAHPSPDLVTNVHVVGFIGERIVVCRDARGVWFLPGGTREPPRASNGAPTGNSKKKPVPACRPAAMAGGPLLRQRPSRSPPFASAAPGKGLVMDHG